MRRAISFVKQRFGIKEWAAVIVSLTIMVIAVWLAHRGGFEELGYLGGFLAMLVGSATIVLPAPGLAIVAALGATVSSPLLLGIVAGIGSAIGELTGYLAGFGSRKLAKEDKDYRRIARFVERYGFWAILLLAFIPNPLFDIAGLMAGTTGYPAKLFFLATLIGKLAKCILTAYAGAWSISWLL